MIYSLRGTADFLGGDFLVVSVGGVSFKVFLSRGDLEVAKDLLGQSISLFSFLRVKEDGLDLYGFFEKDGLVFFELLNSVSGIGPKSALAILGVSNLNELKAAIAEGRIDLLTKVSGVGAKTAERIVLELRDKIKSMGTEGTVKKMEEDNDIVSALVGLGYSKDQVIGALKNVSQDKSGLEDRLKEALKILGGKKK